MVAIKNRNKRITPFVSLSISLTCLLIVTFRSDLPLQLTNRIWAHDLHAILMVCIPLGLLVANFYSFLLGALKALVSALLFLCLLVVISSNFLFGAPFMFEDTRFSSKNSSAAIIIQYNPFTSKPRVVKTYPAWIPGLQLISSTDTTFLNSDQWTTLPIDKNIIWLSKDK